MQQVKIDSIKQVNKAVKTKGKISDSPVFG